MGQCVSLISLCGAQFNRLDCDGNILGQGDGDGRNVVMTCGLVDITRTENVEADTTQRDPNGQGGWCATRVTKGYVTGYDYQITLCSQLDFELMELLGLADVVVDPGSGEAIGWKPLDLQEAQCQCGDVDECPEPGISMLLWSLAWQGDDRHPDWKYGVEAVPRIVFSPGQGTATKSNEFNTITVGGSARRNAAWAQGPGAIYPDPDGLDRHWAEWLTNTGYPGGCACQACGYLLAGDTPVPLG